MEPWNEVPPELADIFVVQHHEATALHRDLRLCMDSMLKSWAMLKEPPATKGSRRLARQVGDHDLSYHDFEGVIEEGWYGAGRVDMWDRGMYELLDHKDSKIVFQLAGDRLKGKYDLLRFKKAGENAWLFFKAE